MPWLEKGWRQGPAIAKGTPGSRPASNTQGPNAPAKAPDV